jgi:predicted alpha/beta superfamily hydrolase
MTTEPPALGGTEVLDVWSEDVGDTFRLFVGRCGPTPRATLVVADGNGLFGLAVDAVRLMQIPGLLPSLAVVGVGHPGAATVADTVGIRERDLTPTAWPAFPGSGGAAAFLRFVRGPVLDRLAERFPGCLATTVFFGHSLGGLFGTWALLQQPPPFTHFVLSSPSLYWDRYAVLAAEQARATAGGGLAAHVYLGIGELEDDAGRRLETRNLPAGHPHKAARTRLDMVDDLRRFAERLGSRQHPGLDLELAVFPGEFHATVPATVLTRGLRHFFARPATGQE